MLLRVRMDTGVIVNLGLKKGLDRVEMPVNEAVDPSLWSDDEYG